MKYLLFGIIAVITITLIVLLIGKLHSNREKKKIEYRRKKFYADLETKTQILKTKKKNEQPRKKPTQIIQPKKLPQKKTTPSKVEENKTSYETQKKKEVVSEPDVILKKKEKKVEVLPIAKQETEKNLSENLFVNYEISIPESTNEYPISRFPHKGGIIRTHRLGNTKRRGYKEESFQKSIQQYFGSKFIVSGEVRLNTGKDTRPFEPDIAVINKKGDKNIRIDIEIDEPYAGITRQPTHCKGDDLMRDTYFVDRGWIVIRFSEFQVHTQEIECLKYIAIIIKKIDSNFSIPDSLNNPIGLTHEKVWDVVQAQKWEKIKYREQYLNHEFGEVNEETETVERDFSEQEIKEEKLVKPSIIGVAEKGENIGFNKTNIHPRDLRIKFYPESHIYTIDNIPAPSASTVISKFFPEFDSYGVASNLSSSNPLFGLPVEEIVEIWNTRGIEAANLGTYLHEQIEKYYLKKPFNETDEFHLFKQFVNDHQDLKPYRSEWRIFDDKFNIAGTIDLIASNGKGYEIYDWKRSKKVIDIFSGEPIKIDTWGNRGIGQLSDVSDTSYNRYCLQQSLYRFILENNYGIKISKMYLIVLYPDYDKYYKVETPYWKDKIEYILKTL